MQTAAGLVMQPKLQAAAFQRQTSASLGTPDMYEAIEGLCCALHQLMLLIRQDLCAGRVSIQDQVQRIVIVRHLPVHEMHCKLRHPQACISCLLWVARNNMNK